MSGCRLLPLPLVSLGAGDVIRAGGASMLAVRRWDPDCMLCGIVGTGGASTALGTGLPGEGSRNVRSDMDPELNLRSICGVPALCDPLIELPTEDVEAVLFKVRFV